MRHRYRSRNETRVPNLHKPNVVRAIRASLTLAVQHQTPRSTGAPHMMASRSTPDTGIPVATFIAGEEQQTDAQPENARSFVILFSGAPQSLHIHVAKHSAGRGTSSPGSRTYRLSCAKSPRDQSLADESRGLTIEFFDLERDTNLLL